MYIIISNMDKINSIKTFIGSTFWSKEEKQNKIF